MDKNKIIAISLISVLFFAFSYFNSKEQEKYNAQKAVMEAQIAEEILQREEARRKVEAESAAKSPEQSLAESVEQVGATLAAAMQAEPQIIQLQNDVMSISFSTRGAIVKDVTLYGYTKYAPRDERNELVKMFDPETAKMDLSFYIRNGLNNQKINTMDYTFESHSIVAVSGAQQLTMTLSLDDNARLEYIYTLYSSDDDARSYMLDFQIKMHNMAPIMSNQTSLVLDWQNKSYQNERGFTNENNYTTLAYHFPNERSIEELAMGTESKSETISTSLDWIAFKQQFFTSAIIAPEGGISNAYVSYNTAAENSGYIKEYVATMNLPLSPASDTFDLALYFGPNKYATLKSINDLGYGELTMEELVPLGWGIFGWVNKWVVIPIFDLLRNAISSFGIIILILAILVKLVISPFTYQSYVSMAKMRIIKPQVEEINARYPKPEDATKKSQATMELYKKAGVNPMGGCIPMLIQMPIVIAMFRFFPASIELRGESFLWAQDLSSYDSVLQLPFNIPFYGDHVSLFALMMAVVLYFYSAMNYNQSASAQPEMAGMKFMMLYMMPIMMLLWFNSYSSGLCYYYFLANLLTIAQTLFIRKSVSDDKIQEIMRATATKNKDKKKSKFQLRYEEALAEQQRQMEAKGKKK
ncbi:MAG: membrane protein insertase YidC [Rikenellaceae bacterium]